MLKEIRNIPLAAFLSHLGYEPARRCGDKLWYRSPLRQEQTPSFKVETTLNCWYDFGLGRGGNIIDLASEMYKSTNLCHLMSCIANNYPVSSTLTVSTTIVPRQSAPSIENIRVVPLESHALVAYLQERGIPPEISKAHCRQIHYCCRDKRYYAVAFANESGGYEIRNRYFKGCIAPKDISIRRIRDDPSTACAVYEGFIDYLSALILGLINGADAIVLNSVSNVNKAIPHLRDYTAIHCFLDNDDAGKSALAVLTKRFGTKVIDRSTLYAGYNDLSEYLTQNLQTI